MLVGLESWWSSTCSEASHCSGLIYVKLSIDMQQRVITSDRPIDLLSVRPCYQLRWSTGFRAAAAPFVEQVAWSVYSQTVGTVGIDEVNH